MVRMPGEVEQWDPMTEAIRARENEGRPYKPQMGTPPAEPAQAPDNPYDAFLQDSGQKAQRIEADTSLVHRFTQHFLEAQRGGSAGLIQMTELALAEGSEVEPDGFGGFNVVGRNPDDPNQKAKAQALRSRMDFERSQYAGMPAAETPLEYLTSVGGELLGGLLDPLSATPVSKVGTVGWRAARPFVAPVIDQSFNGALLNTVSNTALQALEVDTGYRDQFDPLDLVTQTAIGGIAGAAFGTVDGTLSWRAKKAEDFYNNQAKLNEGLARAPAPGRAPMAPGTPPPGRPTIDVTLANGVSTGPQPVPDRIDQLAEAFTQERGLTKESVEKMTDAEKEKLDVEWTRYRDERLAAPEAPTPDGLTRTYGPERLKEAQQTLFGEVKGTRNLTPEELAQVENHLQAGSPENIPQAPIETEGKGLSQPVEVPNSTQEVPNSTPAPPPIQTGPFRLFKPDELKVDAKRFQFKEGGNEAGVTDRLKGVKKWDPTKAGQTLVWEDKAGNFFIADGHQRHGLATRMAGEGQDVSIPAYVLREADGVSAEDARVIAAAKNIAEGTGSAIDAAKILRTRPEAAVDLPPTSALVRDAQGLSQLSDDAFGMVINKKVPAGYAALVGRLAPDKNTHAELLGLLAKEQPENVIEAESMIRDAMEAPTVQATMEDMFGSAEVTQVLFKERAQILSAAATQIRKNRAAFSTLVREEERLTAGGNKLATTSNLERATQDAELLATLQAQARRKGPIADALAVAAKKLKDGESRQTVVRDFVRALHDQAQGIGPNGGNVGGQVSGIAASVRRPDLFSQPEIKLPEGVSLKVDEGNREIRAVKNGQEIGYLSLEKFGEPAQRNEAFNMAVKPEWQRKGLMRAMHQKAEEAFGRMTPSGTLSDEGFAFWKSYRPEAVKDRLRFRSPELMGQKVKLSNDRTGVITSLGDRQAIATIEGGNGATTVVPKAEVERILASVEPGAEGKPQAVIPGAEKITDRLLAERRGAGPLKATKPQKSLDFGLFGSEKDQLDLLDMARQKVSPKLRPTFDAIDWRPDGSAKEITIGDTSLIYQVSPDGVELQSIRTPQMRRGQGSARSAMEVFLQGADALNLTVRLQALPLDRATDMDRLISFYERMGFQWLDTVAGVPDLIRAPDARPMNLDEADLRALINDNAPISEIETHPVVLDAVRRMEELPWTVERPGYNTPEDRARRVFNFDGETVVGTDAAVDRLVHGAMAFSTDGPVRQEAKATIILGPAAAGKSTIAEEMARTKFSAIVDPDEAKKVLPEYNGGVGASATHEESSDIGYEVLARLRNAHMNMIIPKVGHNPDGIKKLTLLLQEHGYHVDIVNLAVSYENAFRRMVARYLKTGRLIDPKYVRTVGELPSETYRTLKERGIGDGFAEIDGNGRYGEDKDILDETPGVLEGVPGLRRQQPVGGQDVGRIDAGTAPELREAPQSRRTEAIAARTRPPQQPVPTNRAQSGTTGRTSGPVERLEDISHDLADLANIPTPVRQGRLARFKDAQGRPVKAAGQYDRNQGVIRLAEMSDFETQAHETAHALETEYGGMLDQLKKQFANEIDPMAYPGATDVNSEGFAEYLRFYVSNPAYAQRNAPGFTQAFTEMLRRRNPDQLSRLNDISRRYQAWTMAPSAQAVAADVVSTRRRNPIFEAVQEGRQDGWRAVIGRYFDKAYSATIDELNPLNKAVKMLLDMYEAKNGKRLDITAAENPYVLARLLQDSYSAGHIDMMHGVVPYHGTKSEGPGLADALQVAFGDGYRAWDDTLMADFAAYLISRRAVHEYERFFNGDIPNVPGKFTKGDYEQTILDLEAAHPNWIQAADMVYDWNRRFLTKKRDAGFLTEEQFQRFLAKPAYVPFQRDLSDIDRIDTPAGRATGNLRDSIAKAFRGSKRSVINPIESMMKDAYQMNALIRRNDVFGALHNLARMVGPGGGSIAEVIPSTQMRGTQVNVAELIKSASKAAGIAEDDVLDLLSSIETKLGADAMGTIFRAGDINEKGEPIVYWWHDGKRTALRLADGEFGRDLYNSMTGMNREMQNLFVSLLSMPSTAIRYGITTAPHFILANYFRDQISAWVLTGNNFLPFISGAAGLRDEITQAEVTRLYNTFGSIMGGGNVAALDKGRAKRDIRALQKQGYSIRRFASVRGFAEFTELSETGSRLAIFKSAFARAKKEGLNDYEAAVEAAFHSRDYIDFGRHGSNMLAARRLIPFLNASIQGLDKTARVLAPALKNPLRAAVAPFVKHRAGMALSRTEHNALANSAMAWTKMTAVGLFGLGLSYIYRDDPEYEEISDYLRATNWMVKKGPGEWYAIPKPFELGFISNLMERGFDAVYGKDPIAMQNFLSGLYDVTAPPTGIPIFKTYYELKHNTDDLGRPIVGPELAGYDPWRQYNGYTSDLAKKLGELTGASPVKIDHAIQGFGSSWGKIIADGSTDLANEQGIFTAVANSVSRRFIREVSRGATSTRAFWDQMSETTGPMAQTAKTYQDLYESKGEGEADRYISTKSDNEKAYAILNATFKAEDKRLHPMTRAQDMMSVISKLRRDIAGNDVVKLDTNDQPAEDRERITLTPTQRQQAQEILSQLSMREARNALIVIGQPGWAQRDIMDTESLKEELRTAMPDLADEFDARIEKKKIYDFDAVREGWPDLKERLLQDRQDADLGDLVAGAK